MHTTTKKIVIIFISIIMLSTCFAFQTAMAQSTDSTSAAPSSGTAQPTAPAWVQVTATANGIEIEWGASQAGDFPLDHYLIESSTDNVTYNQIATVDSNTTTYTDPSGQAGFWYQIIAVDNQDPPNQSAPTTPAQVPTQPDTTTVDTSTGAAASPSSTPSDTTNNTTTPSATTDQSSTNQATTDPEMVAQIVSQTDVDALLTPTPSPVDSTANDAVDLPPAHPLEDPQVSDQVQSQIYAGMSATTNTTVTDIPSLAKQVAESDSHTTVQTPSNRVKLVEGDSDGHLVNLLNTVVQGNDGLLIPLLNRYNYEKTVILTLAPRLTTQDIHTAQSTCQAQSDLLTSTLFNLSADKAALAIEGLANCGAILRL